MTQPEEIISLVEKTNKDQITGSSYIENEKMGDSKCSVFSETQVWNCTLQKVRVFPCGSICSTDKTCCQIFKNILFYWASQVKQTCSLRPGFYNQNSWCKSSSFEGQFMHMQNIKWDYTDNLTQTAQMILSVPYLIQYRNVHSGFIRFM